MTVVWILLGALLGFDAALTYSWLTTRRTNRSVVGRVSLYLPDELGQAQLVKSVIRDLQRLRRRNPTTVRGRKPW